MNPQVAAEHVQNLNSLNSKPRHAYMTALEWVPHLPVQWNHAAFQRLVKVGPLSGSILLRKGIRMYLNLESLLSTLSRGDEIELSSAKTGGNNVQESSVGPSLQQTQQAQQRPTNSRPRLRRRFECPASSLGYALLQGCATTMPQHQILVRAAAKPLCIFMLTRALLCLCGAR